MSTTYRSPVQAVIGLSGLPSQWGGLPATQDRIARLDLPETVGPEHVAAMQAECERFAEAAGRHPHAMANLQNAILRGDQQTTDRAIDQLGLRPQPAEFFLPKLAIAGGILLVLLAAGAALSGDGGTQKVPVGPEGGVPDPGNAGDAGDASDAGTD